MARGGYRPGAGRPKGTTKKPVAKPVKVAPEIKREAKAAGLSPLDYMLQVMNDGAADDARRDRMAIAAAPFVHVKPAEAEGGVKQQRQKRGEGVATGGGKFSAPAGPRLVADNTR